LDAASVSRPEISRSLLLRGQVPAQFVKQLLETKLFDVVLVECGHGVKGDNFVRKLASRL